MAFDTSDMTYAANQPDIDPDLQNRDEQSRRVMASRSLTGDRVRNSAGEDLGTIEEIMLDVPRGRVAYAVLSFGGILGIGSKLFAVPWEALTLNHRDREFILNVDKSMLKDAPGFDSDNWPDMADRRFADQVHRHYGYKPYWETSEFTTGTDPLDREESAEEPGSADRPRTRGGGAS